MEQPRRNFWALQGGGSRHRFPFLWIRCLYRRGCVVLFGSEAWQDGVGHTRISVKDHQTRSLVGCSSVEMIIVTTLFLSILYYTCIYA